jgi:hypothetical protein
MDICFDKEITPGINSGENVILRSVKEAAQNCYHFLRSL